MPKKIEVTAEVERKLDRYKQFMLEREYTSLTARNYSEYVSQFMRLSGQDDVRFLQKGISGFLATQKARKPRAVKPCRAALYLYFKMVTGKNYPRRPPKEHDAEIEAILKRFYDYSVAVKCIRPGSARQEATWIRGFLEHMAKAGPCHLGNITAHNIREFVASRMAHLKDSSKGREITAIRNFFRFQQFDGMPVHKSIFLLPLSPAVWKNSAFPRTIDDTVFNGLHELPDCNTQTGKRDRCIMLCFTELALRCIEVATLSVDDFNWRDGYVAIKNTKTRSDRKLPVSEKLGKAVIEYLRDARPKSASRVLFVRLKHIRGEPMGTEQIRCVVRRVYAKSGAEIRSTGTHILRRTAASKIYNAGNSLKMTADILGHESLDSTARYVKTDMAGLRQVAAPWPKASVLRPTGFQLVEKAGGYDTQ